MPPPKELKQKQQQYDKKSIALDPEKYKEFLADAAAGVKLPKEYVDLLLQKTMLPIIMTSLNPTKDRALLKTFFKLLESNPDLPEFPENSYLIREIYPEAIKIATEANYVKVSAALHKAGTAITKGKGERKGKAPLATDAFFELEQMLALPRGTLSLEPNQINSETEKALNKLSQNPSAFAEKIKFFIHTHPKDAEEVCKRFIRLGEGDITGKNLYKAFLLLFFSNRSSASPSYTIAQIKKLSTAQKDTIKKWFTNISEELDTTTAVALLEALPKTLVKEIAKTIQDPDLIWAIVCSSSSLRQTFKASVKRAIKKNPVDLTKWDNDLKSLKKFLGDFHYALATQDINWMVDFIIAHPKNSQKKLKSVLEVPLRENLHLNFFATVLRILNSYFSLEIMKLRRQRALTHEINSLEKKAEIIPQLFEKLFPTSRRMFYQPRVLFTYLVDSKPEIADIFWQSYISDRHNLETRYGGVKGIDLLDDPSEETLKSILKTPEKVTSATIDATLGIKVSDTDTFFSALLRYSSRAANTRYRKSRLDKSKDAFAQSVIAKASPRVIVHLLEKTPEDQLSHLEGRMSTLLSEKRKAWEAERVKLLKSSPPIEELLPLINDPITRPLVVTQLILNQDAATAKLLYFHRTTRTARQVLLGIEVCSTLKPDAAATLAPLFAELDYTGKIEKAFLLHTLRKSKTGIADYINKHKNNKAHLQSFRVSLEKFKDVLIQHDESYDEILKIVENKLNSLQLGEEQRIGEHHGTFKPASKKPKGKSEAKEEPSARKGFSHGGDESL